MGGLVISIHKPYNPLGQSWPGNEAAHVTWVIRAASCYRIQAILPLRFDFLLVGNHPHVFMRRSARSNICPHICPRNPLRIFAAILAYLLSSGRNLRNVTTPWKSQELCNDSTSRSLWRCCGGSTCYGE
jgi:hypothetical protein